jgi:hypothetical protein
MMMISNAKRIMIRPPFLPLVAICAPPYLNKRVELGA